LRHNALQPSPAAGRICWTATRTQDIAASGPVRGGLPRDFDARAMTIVMAKTSQSLSHHGATAAGHSTTGPLHHCTNRRVSRILYYNGETARSHGQCECTGSAVAERQAYVRDTVISSESSILYERIADTYEHLYYTDAKLVLEQPFLDKLLLCFLSTPHTGPRLWDWPSKPLILLTTEPITPE